MQIKFIGLVLAAVLSTPAFAQTAPVKPEPTPQISVELKAEIFKALAQLSQAQLTLKNAQEDLDKKQANWNVEIGKATKACTDKATAQFDANQEPACVLKPKTDKK